MIVKIAKVQQSVQYVFKDTLYLMMQHKASALSVNHPVKLAKIQQLIVFLVYKVIPLKDGNAKKITILNLS